MPRAISYRTVLNPRASYRPHFARERTRAVSSPAASRLRPAPVGYVFFCHPDHAFCHLALRMITLACSLQRTNPNGHVCAFGGDFRYWTVVETTESGQRIRAGTHNEDPVTALTQRLRALVTKTFAQTRQAPRLAFTNSIEVRIASGTVFRGIARDLSRRGLGAIVCADLQVGDSVLIKYAHPQPPADSQIVVRYARVRGRYGSRYGFEFEHAVDIP